VAESAEIRWLLLIHQIPPKPSYFRVKIWRRLQRLGAVAIKNAAYVLPKSEQALEDFQWLLHEITDGGGEASLCEALFVEGISDDEVEALFRAARDADYEKILEDVRLVDEASKEASEEPERKGSVGADLVRIKHRIAEVEAIDFFGAPGRDTILREIAAIEARILGKGDAALPKQGRQRHEDLHGRTWVTRKGLYIDRLASAWLIRRFIDKKARFKFVPGKAYQPKPGELRFDMFKAEFTHEGDRCTFETFVHRLALDDAALYAIAEIVHDIDLKDAKYGRPEAAGIESLIAGIASSNKDDEARLARSTAVFDDLYEFFNRNKGQAASRPSGNHPSSLEKEHSK
jgi:Uncharacterized conserved protein